jgi:hypothetical protein
MVGGATFSAWDGLGTASPLLQVSSAAMSTTEEKTREPGAASNDEDLLARLGYKQEFKRHFSRLELFGISFSIVGVVQSIAYVVVSHPIQRRF